jgi:hypothetical protein
MRWFEARFVRTRALAIALALVQVAMVPASARAQAAATTAALPQRLSDTEFWDLVSAISEPGGYFRIVDNFTSNEREIGTLFGMLRARGTTGDVYLGVGPEQNLTYIAAIRPRMAFIVDIRRQAVMQHLMFKAVFELAPDRADFVSLLFSKARPAGLDSASRVQRIWEAFWQVPSDTAAYRANKARITDHLTKTHGFRFTAEEQDRLQWVYENFFQYGPQIATRGYMTGGSANGSTFADLTGYSTDASGEPRSFLSSEEHYRTVKSLHERNLIVPVSGDFGGPKAIRAIGTWLRQRGGVVRAFYVSNVEQYLYQDGKAQAFYENVATLPIDANSVFIRPYSLQRIGFSQSLCAMVPYLAAMKAGGMSASSDAQMCGR